MTLILALDAATTTGWCRGEVGKTPTFGSEKLGTGKHNDFQIFGRAIDWLVAHLEQNAPPDSLVIENMLPPQAMKNHTSREVRDRLGGLHGIFKGVAYRYGIAEIACVNVGDVRAHFIGDRSARRIVAKHNTMVRCRLLGWDVQDDNAADACALWDYACCLIDPKLGIRRSPLFWSAAE
jgi:hypothetical protein